jgi:DNA polymerase elongation subunit (family B)
MKHLQDTPWWICDPEDENYCAYVDTDSNYFHAEPLLRHRFPNFDEMSDKEKDIELEKIALEYQDIITKHYDNVAKDVFNVHQFEWFDKPHWLEMKTECVIRSAYFRATRRYAQWITKEEGIETDKLDIKGLEFQKANFPPLLGEFFYEALVDVLKGETQEEIDIRVKEFKKKIIDGTIPLSKLGNPTSVKQINKHQGKPARAGEIFSTFKEVKNKADKKLGAPAAVKASVRYNDLIRFWKLDGKHNLIAQGEKIKWVYLKPNPYQIEELAFLEYDIPEKIRTFLDEYADREKIFDSILLNKLEGFYSDLEWNLNLNPYINQFFEI